MKAQAVVQCAVCCETRTTTSVRWFYLIENRWTDRLQIFQFHKSLAHPSSSYPVCCASHVRELVVHWMTIGRLDLPFARVPRQRSGTLNALSLDSRRTTESSLQEREQPFPATVCLGEIAVHRESLTRILRENPHALEPVLETLVRAIEPTTTSPRRD
jgi:hypothetical protein